MFTKNEVRDLTISIVVLALIFSSFRIDILPMTLFIVIFVFAFHEIVGHKFVAQHYGCSAEYKIWPMGLILGLITAFLPGMKFAAPGAVYISPIVRKKFAFSVAHLTKREYGIISLAGPLVNIVIGISFLLVSLFFPLEIFILTSKFSFFLALFNLIPFPPLDGFKVLIWDKKFWLIAVIVSLVGLFFYP